jgi:hypothetical protein
VGTSELGTVAECAGTERGVATTVGGGRGAAGGGGDAAETVGFGASQVPIGTRAAVAALPTLVVRKVGPDEVGAAGIPAEEYEEEGTADLGGAGGAALRMAAISTFPTGV